MKKILSFILLLSVFNSYSQIGYWTAYNFNVQPGSEELVLKYFNDYFSKNKLAEGVTVSLFENHFKDSNWNYSHQILFIGPLDGLAAQYSTPPSDAWSLFISKMDRHISLYSSFMGYIEATFGEGNPTDYPIQRIYSFDAGSTNKYFKAYKKLFSKFNKDGSLTLTGGFSAGTDSRDGNVWVVNAFKDFKGAFGGHQKLPSKFSNAETQKAYQEFRKNRGEIEFKRGFLRILLASY